MSNNECTNREYNLALEVALSNSANWPTSTCVAWVDSADRTCGKTRSAGLLCKRHNTVAEKRAIKNAEKNAQDRERRAAWRAENLPKWRAELDRIEARMRVMDPPPVSTDPAAYGGNVHPSIRKKRAGFMSDSRVMEMGKLVRRADELRRLIGDNQ